MQAHSWTIHASTNLGSSAYPERAYDNSFGDISTSASLVTYSGIQFADVTKTVTYRCTVDMTNLSAATLKVRRTYALPHTPEDSLTIEVLGPGEVAYAYDPSSSGGTDISYSWDNVTYYLLSGLIGDASGLVQSTVTNESFTLANYTGSNNLRKIIQELDEYKFWRKKIFERDKFTCIKCSVVGGKMVVDHIIPFSEIIIKYKIKNSEDAKKCNLLWDIDNGRTMCKKCHYLTETYGFKQVQKIKKLK